MSAKLTYPVDLYVQFWNAGETDRMSGCFAADAVVHDEGRTYESLAKQWVVATGKKYNHTITPLEWVQRNTRTVLAARLTGNFPGAASPATLQFNFLLDRGKIISLEIHP
jgi:hypothetical protein